ncbi:hypothetical protein ONZ45_g17909 [Pleurotus djamor]|nr:hypothetical protein ONZ45_g17909 [Pleurotus djamor]
MTPSSFPLSTTINDDDKHSNNAFAMPSPPARLKIVLAAPGPPKFGHGPSPPCPKFKETQAEPIISSEILVGYTSKTAAGNFEPFPLRYHSGKQEVDEIVVDQPWSDTYEPSISLEHKDTGPDSVDPSTSRTTHRDAAHPGLWFRCRNWLRVRWVDFFSSRFEDEEQEARYRAESWGEQKRLAFWAAMFLIVNWVLGCAFITQPIVLADQIFYFLIGPLLCFPILGMALADYPLKHSVTYQIILCSFSCGTRDFLSIFYYTSALQTVALFGLGLKRFPATLGAIIWFTISSALILNFRISWIRNSVNFVVYEAALIYMHYQREFVRVPLNTALLAVQNMEASGAISKRFEIEFNALEGSLSMMSKVLNDVLDL